MHINRFQFPKHPNDTKDYQIDWRRWLKNGEAIASYTISAEGVTIVSSSHSNGVITVFLSGGEDKTDAVITCQITTNGTPAKSATQSVTLLIRDS